MPVRASPVFSKLASARSAFNIERPTSNRRGENNSLSGPSFSPDSLRFDVGCSMFNVRCSMFAFPLAASPSPNSKFKILNPPSHQPDATSTTFPIVGDSCSFSKQYWSSCSSAALAERPPPFFSMVPRSSTNGQGSYDPSNTLLFICHHVMRPPQIFALHHFRIGPEPSSSPSRTVKVAANHEETPDTVFWIDNMSDHCKLTS